ncbi:MAG: pyridoxamine 5'-phosphate oxidase family protein [Ilumatobacteraceae bacterium]
MLTFDQFLAAAPAVAGPISERLTAAGLGILGTTRLDGWPRVSPIEVSFVEGRLYMGMMPGSRKHADVLRDPRVSLLAPIADRNDLAGEGKLVGRLDQLDPESADRTLRAFCAAHDLDPEPLAGSPMFELLVAEAAWQQVRDDAWDTLSWSADRPDVVRHRRREGATGESTDVEAR